MAELVGQFDMRERLLLEACPALNKQSPAGVAQIGEDRSQRFERRHHGGTVRTGSAEVVGGLAMCACGLPQLLG